MLLVKLYQNDFTFTITAGANVNSDYTLLGTANYIDFFGGANGEWEIGYQVNGKYEMWQVPCGVYSSGGGVWVHYAYVLPHYGTNNICLFRSISSEARTNSKVRISMKYTKSSDPVVS